MKHATTFDKLDAPSSDEFTRILGKVVWLLSLSKEHTTMTVSTIEPAIMAPLIFKQLRVISDGKRPLAVLTWAYASAQVRQKIETGQILSLEDWRSGKELVVVDCVSPFLDRLQVEQRFLSEIENMTGDAVVLNEE